MQKQTGDYYLGLDIGTNSIGWAVTDPDYNLLKFRGKEMWGVRLFKEGLTAENRRIHRSARRRSNRRKQRIELLQELFSEAISQVDPGFFHRLKDSKFHLEDKLQKQPNTLFNDKDYNDRDFHREFPTIYHLRSALIEEDRVFDVRLVYLAIAHILKHRGHFHYKGGSMEDLPPFEELFLSFTQSVSDLLDIHIDLSDSENFEQILKKSGGILEKTKQFQSLLKGKGPNKQINALAKLLAGGKTALQNLFPEIDMSEAEIKAIQLSATDYDENENKCAAILEDNLLILTDAKKLFDYGELRRILQSRYLSLDKIASYNKHKTDLAKLKRIVYSIGGKSTYRSVFRDSHSLDNYVAYIGRSMKKTNQSVCSKEDFYKTIEKILKPVSTKECGEVLTDIQKGTFLPKQSASENSVIPYQAHLYELEEILRKAAQYLPFLKEKDTDGYLTSEKILKLLTFRIPYYVGPLNDSHKEFGSNTWIVKKSSGAIFPWNFEDVVDLDASQEAFIRRMTNKCTYLIGKDVLPKHSILYSRFMVLNELNNVKINGESIPVDLKKNIFNDLFLKKARVTYKIFLNYLQQEGYIEKSKDTITGIDGDFKSNMAVFLEINKVLGNGAIPEEMIEDIIRDITLFGEEKTSLHRRLKVRYGHELTGRQIDKLTSVRATGWGRLSGEFLTEIYHTDRGTGEMFPIITALWERNENLMQLLSQKYDYTEEIRAHNAEMSSEKPEWTYDELVSSLYCSPAVKRGLWQTLRIVKELHKVMGKSPARVFVEMAREDGEKKRSTSRKQWLSDLYANCKDESRQWLQELGAKTDNELRGKKLFLYYTQMGKCMYSGEVIDIEQLHNNNLYDIDHIYPRSFTKDDSINNTVLVKRSLNQVKDDNYPLPSSFRNPSTIELWKSLHRCGFISDEKYHRLTRLTPFQSQELAGFINRQLVEMRQSSKAVAELLQTIYSDQKTEVIYVKAGNISDFRQAFEFVKVRELNHLHHAKDAYLSIVVGNVYHTKFTANPYIFIQKSKQRFPGKKPYTFEKMFECKVERNGVVAWRVGENGSIQNIRKVMDSPRALITRHSYQNFSSFYHQMPLKKGHGQVPLKSTDPRFRSIEKYGGYNDDQSAYFFLVEHKDKKGHPQKTIEYVPIRMANQIEENPSLLHQFCVMDTPQGLGLTSPKILIEKIKVGTLFYVDGFPMSILSKTNNQIQFNPEVQLFLSSQEERYAKQILKINSRSTDKNRDVLVSDRDGITSEQNEKLYDTLFNKLNETIFSLRPNNQLETFKQGLNQFQFLPLAKQCIFLARFISFFKDSARGVDLTDIGGAEQGGSCRLQKRISASKKYEIVYQSITGLYSQRMDLNEL